MQIHIKSLSKQCIELNVEPHNTVMEVKELIQEKEGIVPSQVKLIYNGRVLGDTDVLERIGVEPGSYLHMVLQLKGGGAGNVGEESSFSPLS